VRLVGEARLPEDIKKVAVRIRGRERVITPLENTWDNFFLNGLRVTDDFMNQRGENK
jgi:antitoxin VapB